MLKREWAEMDALRQDLAKEKTMRQQALRIVVAVHDNWKDDPGTSDLGDEQGVFVRLPLGVLRQVAWLRKELEKDA